MAPTACSRCGIELTGSPSDSSGFCERCALEVSPTLEASPPDGVPATLDELHVPSGFELDASDDGAPPIPRRILNVGDRIGAYTIKGEIGRGGMAVVYRAEQAGLDRDIALKVLSEGPTTPNERVERFLREARAAASLAHPNIVHVHEVGEDRGIRYLAMELVEGHSLDTQIRDEALDWRTATRIVRDAARALHYAHGEGVLHRDVKPGNILIGTDGTSRVTDFGLARVEGGAGLTADGTAIGTPAYMSPEQAAGDQARVGSPTDVYACGAVLYECLTGRPPAIGESVLEVLHAVQSVDPPPVHRLAPGIPRDLATVTEQALRKDLVERYETAEQLAAELDRVLEGQPVHARPIGTVTRIVRRVRRHPFMGAAVAVGILGIALGGVAVAKLAGERRAADRAQREWEQASKARSAARQAAQKPFDHAQTRLANARTARSRGDDEIAARALQQARESIDEVLRTVDDWAEAWLVSGMTHLLAGDEAAALLALDRALALNPKLTDAYYERAWMRFDRYFAVTVAAGLRDEVTGDPLRADLAKLRELDARPERAHAAKAMAALFVGDYGAAASAIDGALQEDPYFADAYALRGAVQMARGHALQLQDRRRDALTAFTKAVKDFDTAIKLGADPDRILAGRAQARAQLRRYKDALKDAERLVALSPDDPTRLFLRARLRKLAGKRKAAAADLARARELSGDTPEAHLLAATVLLADMDHQAQGRRFDELREDLAQAKVDLDWVVSNSPNHSVARFYRAMVNRATGNESACADDLQVFIEERGSTEEYRKLASVWLRKAQKTASNSARARLKALPLQSLGKIYAHAKKAMALVREGRIHDSVPLYLEVLARLESVTAELRVDLDSAEGKAYVQSLRRRAQAEDARVATKGAKKRTADEGADRKAASEPSLVEKLRSGALGSRLEAAVRGKFEWARELERSMTQTAHYNIACSHALRAGEKGRATPEGAAHYDTALTHLERAATAGWSDWRHLERDSDLDAIRGDKRYAAILVACKSRARANPKREHEREGRESEYRARRKKAETKAEKKSRKSR